MTECMSCRRSSASRFFKGEKRTVYSPTLGAPYPVKKTMFAALCERCFQGEQCTDARAVAAMDLRLMEQISEDVYVCAQVLDS